MTALFPLDTTLISVDDDLVAIATDVHGKRTEHSYYGMTLVQGLDIRTPNMIIPGLSAMYRPPEWWQRLSQWVMPDTEAACFYSCSAMVVEFRLTDDVLSACAVASGAVIRQEINP